jgi:hypothetical protein
MSALPMPRWSIDQIWPQERTGTVDPDAISRGPGIEAIQRELLELAPHNNAQRSVDFRRLHCGSASNIAEARWLGVEQAGSSVAVLGYSDVLARYYFCRFWALPAP